MFNCTMLIWAVHEDSLKALAEEHGITNVPLTTFDDETGPRGYKLTRDAEVTVMMWVDGQLAVNETFNTQWQPPPAHDSGT